MTASVMSRYVVRQAKNVAKLLLGRRITYPSLGSVTLDKDDIAIARQYLRHRLDWYDESVVEKYEKRFALWNQSKYAFAFMGGRVALSACIHALDLKPGDEVIIPGYTCVVVPNAFDYAGVETVYADIELDTYGLDASTIEERITANTKAVLLHHLYGLVCRDYERIIEIARRRSLYVIEDCAHSTGALFKDRRLGNLGDIAFFSTEQSKVFTTIQGGVAVTNNGSLANRLGEYYTQAHYPDEELIDKQLHRVIVNYYCCKDPQRWWKGELFDRKYKDKTIISTTEEEEQGIKPDYYGSKMPAAIAAIGLKQLEKVDAYNEERRRNAKRWDAWCDTRGYKKPVVVPHSIPIYLRYPVMVEAEKKSDTAWAKEELGVDLGVWFVSNIHPVSRPVEGCRNADNAVRHCVNFPTLMS
jgi:dTDP-4-amino-4,6-dideoxygalactose transaminase